MYSTKYVHLENIDNAMNRITFCIVKRSNYLLEDIETREILN